MRRLRLHAGNFGAQLRQFPDDTCQILVQVVEVRLLVGSGTRRAGCGRSRWRGEGGPSECGGGEAGEFKAGHGGGGEARQGGTMRGVQMRHRRDLSRSFAAFEAGVE